MDIVKAFNANDLHTEIVSKVKYIRARMDNNCTGKNNKRCEKFYLFYL